jgi:hypothetical protein
MAIEYVIKRMKTYDYNMTTFASLKNLTLVSQMLSIRPEKATKKPSRTEEA